MNKTIGMLMLGLGFIVGISVSVAYAVVADDLICVNCVDKSDLASNSVVSSKIKDFSITKSDLASKSVVSSKIKDFSITKSDLASNSIVSSKIKDHSVINADLDQGAGTSFYRVVDSATGDGGFESRTAMCDPGDIVVGGGYGAGSGSAIPQNSLPLITMDGWLSSWLVTIGGNIYQSVAICQDFRPLH